MVTFQMSMSDAPPPAAPGTATCARCDKPLTDADRVLAVDRAFCRSCYETLTFELQQAMTRMSQDINYPLAALGAALGGAEGALAWWGFTVLTQFGFGLIAVVAGTLAFLVATYLVNMSFVNQVLHERGEGWRVPFPPDSLETLYRVIALNFGVMKLVFLAIVVYEAWVIPRPPKLALAT